MNLSKSGQTKPIILFALAVALLVGVSYGGYRYWQAQQVVPEPQEPEKPVEEKAYEIVDNPDGSKTFYNYAYGYRFTIPEGWEAPSIPSNNLNQIHLSKYISGIWTNVNIMVLAKERASFICEDGERKKIILAGQEAERCDYIPLPPTPDGTRIYLTKEGLSYVIIIEPFDQTDSQKILESFEFLEEK